MHSRTKIGERVIIGANAVVCSDISDNSVAVGIPAKVIKTLDDSIWKKLKNISFPSQY